MSVVLTYGGETVPSVGAGYEVFVADIHRVSMSYRTLTLEFTLAIAGTGSDSQFATKLKALRESFSTPNQALSITIGGEAQFSGDPATHTFMGAEASFAPDPDFQSGKSAAMRVRITGKLPADLAGQGGRLEASVSVARSPEEKRVVTVSAQYTGLSGTAASGHEATFTAYAAAIVAAFGSAFEISSPASYERNDFDQLATFSTVYTELLSDQGPTGTDHASLVNTRYSVDISKPSLEMASGLGGAPASIVRVTFETGVKVSSGDTVKSMVAVIVPFLASRAAEAGASGTLEVLSEQIRVNLMDRRAEGFVEFLSFARFLLRATVRVRDQELLGNNVVPVLDGKDPLAGDLHVGPALRLRTVVIFTRVLGATSSAAESVAKTWIQRSHKENFIHQWSEKEKETLQLISSTGFGGPEFTETGLVLSFRYLKLAKPRPVTPNQLVG